MSGNLKLDGRLWDYYANGKVDERTVLSREGLYLPQAYNNRR